MLTISSGTPMPNSTLGAPVQAHCDYDLDFEVKRPVSRCATLCPAHADMCAVRDPVATWPVRSKTYQRGLLCNDAFEGVAKALSLGTDYRTFAEQDTMNDILIAGGRGITCRKNATGFTMRTPHGADRPGRFRGPLEGHKAKRALLST